MIGVANLVPIPAFDGGQLLIALGEAAIGRHQPRWVRVPLMLASAALIVALIVAINARDLLA